MDDNDTLSWAVLGGTPAALERERVEEGEPAAACGVAGLQFYTYRRDNGMDGLIAPQAGDRLHVVRAPDNPEDPNAVEIWWRNTHHLGHLPRHVARQLAPLLDGGTPLRVYVLRPGNGQPWSLRVLMVGEAARVLRPDLPAARLAIGHHTP